MFSMLGTPLGSSEDSSSPSEPSAPVPGPVGVASVLHQVACADTPTTVLQANDHFKSTPVGNKAQGVGRNRENTRKSTDHTARGGLTGQKLYEWQLTSLPSIMLDLWLTHVEEMDSCLLKSIIIIACSIISRGWLKPTESSMTDYKTFACLTIHSGHMYWPIM